MVSRFPVAVLSPLVLPFVLLCALAACGEPASPEAPAPQLVIVVDDGSGTKTTWELSCDPVGGTHPEPDAACQALTEHGETALAAVPDDQMCTQQYGGPETATINGTWQGKPVKSTLSRKNGCEIARWDALKDVLAA